MFPLPLKHNTLSRSYQFLLVFQTAFLFLNFCFTNSSKRVLPELPLSKVFKLWSWKTRWCSPFLSQYIPSLQTRFTPCAISENNRAAVIERVVRGLNQSRVACYRELGKLLSSLTWWWCFYIKSVMRHTYYNFRFTKWNKKVCWSWESCISYWIIIFYIFICNITDNKKKYLKAVIKHIKIVYPPAEIWSFCLIMYRSTSAASTSLICVGRGKTSGGISDIRKSATDRLGVAQKPIWLDMAWFD